MHGMSKCMNSVKFPNSGLLKYNIFKKCSPRSLLSQLEMTGIVADSQHCWRRENVIGGQQRQAS